MARAGLKYDTATQPFTRFQRCILGAVAVAIVGLTANLIGMVI